jgi:hypothetical protein
MWRGASVGTDKVVCVEGERASVRGNVQASLAKQQLVSSQLAAHNTGRRRLVLVTLIKVSLPLTTLPQHITLC